MPDAMLRLCGALAAISLTASAAQAATVKEVFEKYNLVGTFARDCTKPASKDNVYFVNRVIDAEHVQRDQMSGPTTRDVINIFDKATALGPNEVSVSGKRGEQAFELVWRVEQNRHKGMEATFAGKKTLTAGRQVHNGQNTEWLNKCGTQ